MASAAMTAAARCTLPCHDAVAVAIEQPLSAARQSSLKKASLRSSRPASESATSHAPRPSSGRNATSANTIVTAPDTPQVTRTIAGWCAVSAPRSLMSSDVTE